jgi:Tfp pilus assembly protein PilF
MDKAHIKLLEACQLDPSNADIHVSLGVLYLNYIHDKEKASMHLREALRINPKHKQAVEMRDIINKLALGEKGS